MCLSLIHLTLSILELYSIDSGIILIFFLKSKCQDTKSNSEMMRKKDTHRETNRQERQTDEG